MTSLYCWACVQPGDDRDFLAVFFAAHAGPNRAQAVFGQRADRAVVVQHRPAQRVIRFVIAQKAERQHGCPANLAQTVQGQPLQRALRNNAAKSD